MTDALTAVSLLLVVVAATISVLCREPVRQAAALAVLGLALAVLFTVLQAPDVAMSQLAVGTALTPAADPAHHPQGPPRTRRRRRAGCGYGYGYGHGHGSGCGHGGGAVKDRTRLLLFVPAAAVLAGFLAAACLRLPPFGTDVHPYGDRAVAAALAHHTANVVSSVNFDLRALDTLVEESILFVTVLASTLLLRLARDEHKGRPRPGHSLPTTRLFGAVLLPVALVVGVYVVAHGQLTPGGGFQGGVVLATALHLAYLAADYRVLEKVRPLTVLDVTDALAAVSFTVMGLAGLAAGGAYLENVLPLGAFGQITSGGFVPLFNAAVGVEVGSGLVVLLAHFLDQAVEIGGSDRPEDRN
ncbi:MnhB domain-containing protein [Streptomyces sp. NPDC048269]|uniref:MnhB domain-containing protein n=1 Tax=Streptomyces sp. NPDC048269 TaxID=3155753 RepID=UPI00344AFFF1